MWRFFLAWVLLLLVSYGWAASIVVDRARAPGSDFPPRGTVIVLGKRPGVEGIDSDFLSRIRRLDAMLGESGDRKAIATGSAWGGWSSEAALVAQALPHRAIVLEEAARTTRENLRFAPALADPALPLAVITSRYHLARTEVLAKQKGLELILVPAEDRWEWSSNNVAAVAREALLYWPARWGW